ncbi:hypothetical protein BDP55DRAFT_544498 [Colletotrichum godetiae]|uniref:Fungal N-terminal domain-containing protein n=1 Tax=Colletotrichum godetiae TaxID=1209918 RepID=A0AAJ0F0E3_9PEZI|nr:uncharacterized protein BDP55DRAFT_544498 [Colletotrichum godetiae]KAK1690581.1 hypothetical protein BDP55DRAFT_544498 [Colletotrichum godetiae]
MAELGIAAGVAGFVSLSVQIGEGVSKLRAIRDSAGKAATNTSTLIRELDLLTHVMQDVITHASSLNDSVIQHCQADCDQVVRDMKSLITKIPRTSKSATKASALKLLAFRDWKENVEALQRSIQGAKINLILITTSRTSNQLNELNLVSQLQTSIKTAGPPGEPASKLVPTAASDPTQSLTASVGTVSKREHFRARPNRNCLSRLCSCVCHRKSRTKSRFWALEYTPWGTFQQSCDLETCTTTKYGASVRLALSQLGIKWAVDLEIYAIIATGKFSLRPSLEVEQIVPYTSPGFEIIWRCATYRMSFEEASRSLRQLHEADPYGFKRHVNPGGKSYIEELLRYPWQMGKNQIQWKLLRLFMQEFRVTKGTESATFLVQCAMWIGEGPHLDLLEILLGLGYDVSEVVGDFQDWPQLSSPNWISEAHTPDPFFIEYFGIVCKHNQGKRFAGMTPLHEAILLESTDVVVKWISKSRKDEKNSLGQTPLHLAVADPQCMGALIEAGHDVNSTDIHGITPLMYAAAADQAESAILLIEAGASINAVDTTYGRDFIYYAATRRHWRFILNFLLLLEDLTEDLAENGIVETWVQNAVILYHVVYPRWNENYEISLHQLLMKCSTANFTFDDMTLGTRDNCLLHYRTSITDFEALLGNGFELFNHMNSHGQTPLMVATKLCEPDLVKKLIEVGADVKLKDLHHRTALHFALSEVPNNTYHVFWTAMEIMRILLARGADVFSTDDCVCPCSSGGRLSAIDLINSSSFCWQSRWGKPLVGAIELLCVTIEYRGEQEGKDLLLSFLQWEKHEELGMSHLCFQRHLSDGLYGFTDSSRPVRLQDEDIDAIIDEESEFLDILENEMEESNAKSYEDLLNDWFDQMTRRFDKLVEEEESESAKKLATATSRVKVL